LHGRHSTVADACDNPESLPATAAALRWQRSRGMRDTLSISADKLQSKVSAVIASLFVFVNVDRSVLGGWSDGQWREVQKSVWKKS